MMKRGPWVRAGTGVVALGLVLVGLAWGPGAAHPFPYVGGSGGTESPRSIFVTGTLVPACTGLVALGAVCMPVGHVTPVGSPGSASLAISDDGVNPPSGTYCQDLDVDGLCGEQFEPFKRFCTSTVITVGLDWQTTAAIQVHVDGPLYGNPLMSSCGFGATSLGTMGVVLHS